MSKSGMARLRIEQGRTDECAKEIAQIWQTDAGFLIANAQRFYADVKGRMKKVGRNPEHLKILPGALVVVQPAHHGRVADSPALHREAQADSDGSMASSIASIFENT